MNVVFLALKTHPYLLLEPTPATNAMIIPSGETVHSGDNTVPYVSLSYAHNWLEDEKGREGGQRWEEHKPEVTHPLPYLYESVLLSVTLFLVPSLP